MQQDHATIAFFAQAIEHYTGVVDHSRLRVLDFGCGAGGTIKGLLDLGFDAYGADIDGEYTADRVWAADRISIIEIEPYRLPYPSDTFDAVFSATVLEHAQNKDECLREIKRVLKPGGISIHLVPSKWYLPVEPHIGVPLVSAMWPHVPAWYLKLWALLGVRNENQTRMSWREVAASNIEFVEHGLHYWSSGRMVRAARGIFGNCEQPHRYFMENSIGGAAKIARTFPLAGFTAWLLAQIRMYMIVSRKLG